MSDVRHTPGPWYVNKGDALSTFCVCAEVRGEGWGSSVATVNQRDGSFKPLRNEEAMANARLIAAAPDLLKHVKVHADRGDTCAQKLLAKAIGETTHAS